MMNEAINLNSKGGVFVYWREDQRYKNYDEREYSCRFCHRVVPSTSYIDLEGEGRQAYVSKYKCCPDEKCRFLATIIGPYWRKTRVKGGIW